MQFKSPYSSKLNRQSSSLQQFTPQLRRYAMLSGIGLLLSLSLWSCGESRVSQCNKIVTVVGNFKDTELPNDLAGLNMVAANIDKSRVEIQAIAIQDQGVRDLQTALVALYDDASQALKSQAKALEAKDKKSLDKAKKDLQAAATKESTLVDRFNALCAN